MSQTLIPPSLSSSTLSEKSNLLNPPSPFFSNPTFRHWWHSRNRLHIFTYIDKKNSWNLFSFPLWFVRIEKLIILWTGNWVLVFLPFRHAIVDELVGFGARVHTRCRNESELDGCLSERDNLGFGVTGSVCYVWERGAYEHCVHFVWWEAQHPRKLLHFLIFYIQKHWILCFPYRVSKCYVLYLFMFPFWVLTCYNLKFWTAFLVYWTGRLACFWSVDKYCREKHTEIGSGFHSCKIFCSHGNQFWIYFPYSLSTSQSIRSGKHCIHLLCIGFCFTEVYVCSGSYQR